jgi:hypothetical protein
MPECQLNHSGCAGSGKSSLVAAWVAQRKGVSLGEQEIIIPHFVELSDNSVHRILGRILGTSANLQWTGALQLLDQLIGLTHATLHRPTEESLQAG